MGGWQDKFLFKRLRQTLDKHLGIPNSKIREICEICGNPRFRQKRVTKTLHTHFTHPSCHYTANMLKYHK
ncbi:hypothetical protein C6501_09805 [Candidatus Poribacteria bacterium]|nr:MAG: hypothetical protein C6501_09805 [Candidatus Poribacteria bacterium]